MDEQELERLAERYADMIYKGKNHRRSLLRRATLPLEEGYLSQAPDHRALREAVAALPRNHRRAVDLYYYEGYSTGEIATILRTKEATVRTWLRRGRQRLKEYLTEEVTL